MITNTYASTISAIDDVLSRLATAQSAIDKLKLYSTATKEDTFALVDFCITTGSSSATDKEYIGYIEDARMALEKLSADELELLGDIVLTGSQITDIYNTFIEKNEDDNKYDVMDQAYALLEIKALGYEIGYDTDGETVVSITLSATQYINAQYDGMIAYYSYIDYTISNIVSTSDSEDDGEYVAVYGLATKVDTSAVADFDEATSISLFVDAVKLDETTFGEIEDDHEVQLSYDIKLYAQVTVGNQTNDPEQIQPAEDEYVSVTIPLTGISSVDNLRLYHQKDSGEVSEIEGVVYSYANGMWYATFNIDSFSEFVVTDAIKEVADSSSSSSVKLSGDPSYSVDGTEDEEEVLPDVETPSETASPSETVSPSATTSPSEGASESGLANLTWIWIILAIAVVCGAGYVVYKKKKQ